MFVCVCQMRLVPDRLFTNDRHLYTTRQLETFWRHHRVGLLNHRVFRTTDASCSRSCRQPYVPRTSRSEFSWVIKKVLVICRICRVFVLYSFRAFTYLMKVVAVHCDVIFTSCCVYFVYGFYWQFLFLPLPRRLCFHWHLFVSLFVSRIA